MKAIERARELHDAFTQRRVDGYRGVSNTQPMEVAHLQAAATLAVAEELAALREDLKSGVVAVDTWVKQ